MCSQKLNRSISTVHIRSAQNPALTWFLSEGDVHTAEADREPDFRLDLLDGIGRVNMGLVGCPRAYAVRVPRAEVADDDHRSYP